MSQETMLFPVQENELPDVIGRAKDWALSHGVLMRTAEDRDSSEIVNYTPFTLFPLRLPRERFEQAVSIQTNFNLLMHRVAMDHEFLHDSLKQVVEADGFIKNLWAVYMKSRNCAHTQPINLLLSRSDYMLDTKFTPPQLKQVEFNTMAASFSGLTNQIPPLQRFILDICGSTDHHEKILDTRAADEMAAGLIQSWDLYGNSKAVILFLVEEGCRNILDQRWLEWKVYEQNKSIRVIRRSFRQLENTIKVDSQGCLIVDDFDVAVVYIRTAYIPEHFTSQKDWDIRTTIECSRAIKCPTSQHHLAGSKKIQQLLCRPGVVEKFIPDTHIAEQLRKTFTGLYTLDLTEEGDAAAAMAMNSEHYVMKPQREGGDNNTYGAEVGKMLQSMGKTEERTRYILMDRIYPEVQQNMIIKPHQTPKASPTVSELGIYGLLIGSRDKIYINKEIGYLIRTKNLGVDEGGVATGYSGLSSVFLV